MNVWNLPIAPFSISTCVQFSLHLQPSSGELPFALCSSEVRAALAFCTKHTSCRSLGSRLPAAVGRDGAAAEHGTWASELLVLDFLCLKPHANRYACAQPSYRWCWGFIQRFMHRCWGFLPWTSTWSLPSRPYGDWSCWLWKHQHLLAHQVALEGVWWLFYAQREFSVYIWTRFLSALTLGHFMAVFHICTQFCCSPCHPPKKKIVGKEVA